MYSAIARDLSITSWTWPLTGPNMSKSGCRSAVSDKAYSRI